MIPIRLELRNFMSYGEAVPPLDLSGMRTLCLSGDNGHGKSALLDAITWSLWGESRAGKNRHDDLVRLGADEMSVAFTFEMDGLVYRVLRKRSKRAAGNQWELQQATPDQGLGAGWRPLTGSSAGETEAAIQKLLRMSYDTFLNSAYLRQGQADQFVRQPPGKRKEILADILDLSRYDQLEAKAREKSKIAAAEATDLERDINGMDAELAHEPEHAESVAALQIRLDASRTLREVLHAAWGEYQAHKGRLESRKQYADGLWQQQAGLDGEIRDLTHELAEIRAEAAGNRALLARKDALCADYAALTDARRRMEQLTQDLDKWHRGRQMLAATEKEWVSVRGQVQQEVALAVAAYEDTLKRLQDYAQLKAEHEFLAARVADVEALQERIQETRDALEEKRAQYLELQQEHARLNEQLRQWDERLTALAQQRGTCSVCNSLLPAEKVAATQAEYEAQRSSALGQRNQARAAGSALKSEVAALEQQWKSLEDATKAGQRERDRFLLLGQQLFKLEELQKDVPSLASVRRQAEQTLASGDFAPEIRAKMDKYERGLQALAHVEADHAATAQRLAGLADAERLYLQLEHAQGALAATEARLARTEKSLAARRESRAAVEAQLASLAGVAAELAGWEARGQEIKAQEAQRGVQEHDLRGHLAHRQHALDRCQALKNQRADAQRKLTAAKKDQEVHEQLTRAFGKKGVQALIIDNAIPELQEEANRILERLTDGDMSLYFDTLREAKTKKTGPIETLDIKVSDNLGTRPLEMYSGGEGFRAAFALRIALSKLLARRAGARLQTLIIDEGFGTQDGKGREKLIEALNAIQDDFEKIIVITHIDELKDAFASRIEVTKTPAGSMFTVIEGGAG